MNSFYTSFEQMTGYFKRATARGITFVPTLLACCLLQCWSMPVSAQVIGCPAGGIVPIVNFAAWDWTIPASHPNYCATWVADLGPFKKVLKAPWDTNTNGAVSKLRVTEDYTRAKGWELLRMDMGMLFARKAPYFILYNRYSGIIRAFFYVEYVAGFTKGMTITMSHTSSNGNRNSGILALSQPLIQSQDYYLQNQSGNDEVVSYAAVFTGDGGWVYGDFQAGFDSYAGNARYTSTSLQFAVSAITSSDVRLDGKFNFQTNQDIATDLQTGGYAVGGRATNAGLSGLNNFLTKGQKVLKSLSYEDLTKFKSGFTTKIDKTAATVPIPVVQAQQGTLKTTVTSSSSSGSLLNRTYARTATLSPKVPPC